MNFATGHWKRVAEVRASLPASVVLVSLPGSDGRRGGIVTLSDRETAAKLIVGKSHRLATDAEVAVFQADTERRTKLAQSTEAARLGRIA